MYGGARVAMVTLAAGLLLTGCFRPAVSAGVGYEPPEIPIDFSVSFTVNPDGGISVEGEAGIVTEAGIFSVHAGIETSAQPQPGQTVLIIRHWRGQELVDTVYHIGTDEQIVVTVNGHTVIGVSDHKVVIDDTDGRLLHIKVRSSAVSVLTSRQLLYSQLRIGYCLLGSSLHLNRSGGTWPYRVTEVTCSSAHLAQVFYIGYWRKRLRFPGSKPLDNAAVSTCRSAFRQYDGRAIAYSRLNFYYVVPSLISWAQGSRKLVCLAFKPTKNYPGGAFLHRSIKGTRW